MEGVYSIRMHVLAFHPDSASYNLYSSGSEDESQVDTLFSCKALLFHLLYAREYCRHCIHVFYPFSSSYWSRFSPKVPDFSFPSPDCIAFFAAHCTAYIIIHLLRPTSQSLRRQQTTTDIRLYMPPLYTFQDRVKSTRQWHYRGYQEYLQYIKRPSRATFLAKLLASDEIQLVLAYLIEKYEFRWNDIKSRPERAVMNWKILPDRERKVLCRCRAVRRLFWGKTSQHQLSQGSRYDISF